MNKLIRLSKSNISKEEIKEVKQVLKLGFLGMGQRVKEFEKRLTNFFQERLYVLIQGQQQYMLLCSRANRKRR